MGLLQLFKKRAMNTFPFDIKMNNSTSYGTALDATSQACLDLICSNVATLPLDLFDRNTREKKNTHYLHKVFKNPNADETRSTFFYNLTKDYFYGNAYIYKYTNDEGEIISLFRFDPTKVKVVRDAYNVKKYFYNDKEYDYKQIIHIPSRWGYNGTTGKSIFDEYKSIFNTAKEIDQYTNNAFNNSLGKRLVIDISNAFPNATPEQIEALRQKYIANYTGQENAGKPFVKTNKVELTSLDSGLADNRASQLMENREFQEKEVAKLFGVPLSFLRGENKYGAIEDLFMIFMETAIKPITVQFEESFNKLLYTNEKDNLYFEFNYDSLVKTNLMTKIDTYTKQLTHGILTLNEVRQRQNMKPVDGGDNAILSGGNFFVVSQENIDAYMSQKKESVHSPLGDDKL